MNQKFEVGDHVCVYGSFFTVAGTCPNTGRYALTRGEYPGEHDMVHTVSGDKMRKVVRRSDHGIPRFWIGDEVVVLHDPNTKARIYQVLWTEYGYVYELMNKNVGHRYRQDELSPATQPLTTATDVI